MRQQCDKCLNYLNKSCQKKQIKVKKTDGIECLIFECILKPKILLWEKTSDYCYKAKTNYHQFEISLYNNKFILMKSTLGGSEDIEHFYSLEDATTAGQKIFNQLVFESLE